MESHRKKTHFLKIEMKHRYARALSKQHGFLRSLQSLNWIWKGWRRRFLHTLKTYGFSKGLSIWRAMIANPFLPFDHSIQQPLLT